MYILFFHRNALSLEMLKAVKNNLLAETGEEVRVIIISGEGSVFCAGHDLKELVKSLSNFLFCILLVLTIVIKFLPNAVVVKCLLKSG